MIIFALPPTKYDPIHEQERNRSIALADTQNHKRDRDLDVGLGQVIILTDSTGVRWRLSVDTAGALTVTAA